jgi:hypothetical protein
MPARGRHARLRPKVRRSRGDDLPAPIFCRGILYRRAAPRGERHDPCAERHYLTTTRPYFVRALLCATEDLLAGFLTASPEYAPVVDAIFCVAGSEGFRDLIRLYDARALEHAIAATASAFPDILAFVNIHERPARDAEGRWQDARYEVWCPGYDLAKECHQQCAQAARSLVEQYEITFTPPLSEEVLALPEDLVAHLTAFVRNRTTELIRQYDIQ